MKWISGNKPIFQTLQNIQITHGWKINNTFTWCIKRLTTRREKIFCNFSSKWIFLPGKRKKNANESTSSMRKSCSLRHEKVMYLRMNGIHSFFAVALVPWVLWRVDKEWRLAIFVSNFYEPLLICEVGVFCHEIFIMKFESLRWHCWRTLSTKGKKEKKKI